MKFIWPDLLWLLVIVPVLALVYIWLLRRRKKLAARYASLTMIREAIGMGQRVRRHVPPFLFLIALAIMLVAVARPTAIVTLPSQHDIIVLAIDVSGSMHAADVKPNRLAAAQAAARNFVAELPAHTRVGVVSFAATASVVQAPTRNREDLVAAIDRFQLQRGTAVGSGVLVSLKTIFPDVEFNLRASDPRRIDDRDSRRGATIDRVNPGAAKAPFKPVPPGSYNAAAIILLTDGRTTTGPDPVEAARIAAERGVRVFTVGIGTPEGEVIGFEGWSMRVRLDEDTLKEIANVTRGEYYYAGTSADLKKVYDTLNAKIVFESRETEVTALFAAAALLVALVSALLSLFWFNRIL
jgi:Ca-activated chloride channel family protein